MPSSIRARLLLLMMTVLLPAIGAALFIVARTYQGERDAVQRSLRDSARAVAQVIDRELARRSDIARAMTTSQLLSSPADANGPDPLFFHAWAGRVVEDLGGWVELHSASHVLVDTRLPAGSPPRGHGGDGFVLSQVPVVLPLRPGSPGGALRAQVVQPLLREGGGLLNLVIAVPPEVLQRVIDHQHMPANWVGAVIDNGLQVVARHPGGVAYAGRDVAADLREVTADLRERLLRDSEGAFSSVTLEGAQVLGFFSKTPQGWAYLAAAPNDALIGETPAAVLQVVLGALGLLAAAALAARWVGRGIARERPQGRRLAASAPPGGRRNTWGGPAFVSHEAESLKDAALTLQAGGPVSVRRTGIAEFDEVGSTLAGAGQALGRARQDLERQVADAVARTRVAEQRASQSQRIAVLGRLTGGVVHDFNNLLGVISNSAHLIEHLAAHNPALQMPVAATLRAVEMGSHLSQQLLRFGGRQPVSPRPVDLAGYLPELRELLQMVVRQQIPVHIDVRPGIDPVKVDVSELELALINLALNARDAMPKGGQLWLQARNAAPDEVEGLPPGRHVLVAVTDNGVGVDEAVAAQAFEPFFTTKGVGQGSGLGLSQVHGFCVQAGGTARMASTPGLGSTITLVLPACEPALAPPPPPSLPPLPPVAEQGRMGATALAGIAVLLVEDNQALADVTVMLLQSYGCQVRHARNVDDALAQYEADDRVQLVLSDVVMPGGRDGVDLARELRRRQPALPVVLLSGYSAALAGLTDFPVLRKPVTADELVRTLVAALQGHAPGSASGSS